MPDITMCRGTDCKDKNTCYRYTALANPFWQSFFSKPPLDNTGCKYYSRDEAARKVDRLKLSEQLKQYKE